jgi:hypothetical protein
MSAVENSRPEVIEMVIVGADQPFRAVGVAEYPRAEFLLDKFLLFAGGQRRLGV